LNFDITLILQSLYNALKKKKKKLVLRTVCLMFW